MSITVNIADAKERLSELLARAQAGEQVVISRDNAPVAFLRRLPRSLGVRAAIEEFCVARFGFSPMSLESLASGRDEKCRS